MSAGRRAVVGSRGQRPASQPAAQGCASGTACTRRAPDRNIMARRADAGGLDDLRDWLRGHYKTARLVVIDTLQMIRGQRSRNEGVYADDYQAVGQLKILADKSNVPFIAVHHLRNEAAGDPLESVTGTAGRTGSADTILVP